MYLKLQYLAAHAAWVFTFGDTFQKLGDQLLHAKRKEAEQAAASHGLRVQKNGRVIVDTKATRRYGKERRRVTVH